MTPASSQVPTALHECAPSFVAVLEEVRRVSLATEPVRGLFWLALSSITAVGQQDWMEAAPVMHLARELSAADTRGLRHEPATWSRIRTFLEGLPTDEHLPELDSHDVSVVYLNWPGIERVDDVEVDHFKSQGVGGGAVEVNIVQPCAWTPLGMVLRRRALDGAIDAVEDGVHNPAIRSLHPLLPLAWVHEELLAFGLKGRIDNLADAECARQGSIQRPLDVWNPAYRDRAGTTHDAFDLLVEKTAPLGVALATHWAMQAAGERSGAALAATQACRLHDIAAHEYRPLRNEQHYHGQGEELGVEPGSAAHRALGLMVLAGAELTAQRWGSSRSLGRARPEHGHLATLLCELPDDGWGRWGHPQRLQALQQLHALGHDVVRARVGDDPTAVHETLPLYAAINQGDGGSAAALVEWGADIQARIRNQHDDGPIISVIEKMEAGGARQPVASAVRAALARREARRLVDEIAPQPAAPQR